MQIAEEIEKQVNAGFSAEEIMANLRNSSYTYDEINQNLEAIKRAPSSTKAPSGKRSVLSTIISFIVTVSVGLSLAKRGHPGFGAVLILIALILLIVSILLRLAKR